ncbi:hypothetical protein GGF32_006718 [Allomyces javanicus]|nr:hypothetical protein GGF32_006718 [Allomyces javanicus]
MNPPQPHDHDDAAAPLLPSAGAAPSSPTLVPANTNTAPFQPSSPWFRAALNPFLAPNGPLPPPPPPPPGASRAPGLAPPPGPAPLSAPAALPAPPPPPPRPPRVNFTTSLLPTTNAPPAPAPGQDPDPDPDRAAAIAAARRRWAFWLLLCMSIVAITIARSLGWLGQDEEDSNRTHKLEKLLAKLTNQTDALAAHPDGLHLDANEIWANVSHGGRETMAKWQADWGHDAPQQVHHRNKTGEYYGVLEPAHWGTPPTDVLGELNYTSPVRAILLVRNHAVTNATLAKSTNATVAMIRLFLNEATDHSDPGFSFVGYGVSYPNGAVYGVVTTNTTVDAYDVLGSIPTTDPRLRTAAVPALLDDLYELRQTVQSWLSGEKDPPAPPIPSDRATNCTFFFHMQLEQVNLTAQQLLDAETEADDPIGAWVPAIPTFRPHLWIESPECGRAFSSVDMTGYDRRVLHEREGHLVAVLLITSIIKMWVTMNVMDRVHTIANMAKMSWVSLVLGFIVDSTYCLFLLTNGLLSGMEFPGYFIATFVEFMHLVFFQLRLVTKVVHSQQLSWATTLDRIRMSMFMQFYILIFVLMAVIHQGYTRFPPLLAFIVFFLFSGPAFQAARSARVGSAPPIPSLSTATHVAMRLVLPAYLLACPANLYIPGNTHAFPWTPYCAGWLVLQLVLVTSQQYFRADWLVPRAMRAHRYQYSRVLDEDEQERVADQTECAICMMPLAEGGGDEPGRIMVTPCLHLFHAECLGEWLGQHRLTCPTCRAPVPVP